MRYRVVCVSRAIGAGGETVGQQVADRLGFGYYDDEVISLAAQQAGIDATTVAAAEHHQSLLTRLLDTLTRAPLEERLLPLATEAAYYSPRVHPAATLPQEELRRFIHSAIAELADRGDAVIVAHAASIVLARRKDVLRVFVTASEATRRERVWLDGKLLNEEEAARAVAESDRERARYLERFFDLRAEPPTLYDLVVNTDALRVDQAVGAVAAAVGSRQA
jgi:cytidylate kinase